MKKTLLLTFMLILALVTQLYALEGTVYFIVDKDPPGGGDQALAEWMTGLGLEIITTTAVASNDADAYAADIVVIMESVGSGDVNNKFELIDLPVINTEAFLDDDMKLATDFGNAPDFTNTIEITDPTHPLAAGLDGVLQVYQDGAAGRIAYGQPAESAQVVAIEPETGLPSIFVYERDAPLLDGEAAQGMRINLFHYGQNGSVMTEAGLKLWEAALYYAFGQEMPTAVDQTMSRPLAFDLTQNFPNPFNPVTSIDYSLKAPGFVNLSVFNLSGQHVLSLVNEVQSAGTHHITVDASALSSGIYFYRLQAQGQTVQRKMNLIR